MVYLAGPMTAVEGLQMRGKRVTLRYGLALDCEDPYGLAVDDAPALGQREVHAQAVVAAGVHEAGREPDGPVVRPQLHHGLDLDQVLADAGLGRAVDVVGPGVGRGDEGPGPHGTPLGDQHHHRLRGVSTNESSAAASSCRESPRSPPSARSSRTPRARRERERAAGAVDLDPCLSPLVSITGPSPDSLTSTGWASGAGTKVLQPKPGTSSVRATMRRIEGWSIATRTTASGLAPSLV